MDDLSYARVQAGDAAERDACPLKWDCEHCTKTLCVQLVAVADFPSLFGHHLDLGGKQVRDPCGCNQ
ncbi:MAG: hypothetical protein NTV61_03125 [Candidatus Bathyarchaeota archaeon]|nr:hypothetical protein [Candidatus Bathyarchaeota archaeon]